MNKSCGAFTPNMRIKVLEKYFPSVGALLAYYNRGVLTGGLNEANCTSAINLWRSNL